MNEPYMVLNGLRSSKDAVHEFLRTAREHGSCLPMAPDCANFPGVACFPGGICEKLQALIEKERETVRARYAYVRLVSTP